MKIRNLVRPGPLLVLLALTSCTTKPGPIPTRDAAQKPVAQQLQTNRPSQQIPAADQRFHYGGRIDYTDTNSPVLIWQASQVSIDFEGNTVQLLFGGAKGQNYFNANVDGSNAIVEENQGMPVQPVTLSGFGPGRHHLKLFKRSEANAGTVHFEGIEISPNATVWASSTPRYKLTMEFIGDSITVGACNEDGAADQWDNRRTHDCALSYATLTADAFPADYRNIAVSGMGVAVGWVPMLAGQTWDRLYPDTNSPPADLRAWTPDVVFVNFGENDGSYPTAHGQTFPTNFAAGYVALVHAIRAAYPEAHVVLLRGGMYNGAQNQSLREGWETAVAQLETTDRGISHFVFIHWTSTHPRVTDDRIMAGELIAWLKQQDFMQAYR